MAGVNWKFWTWDAWKNKAQILAEKIATDGRDKIIKLAVDLKKAETGLLNKTTADDFILSLPEGKKVFPTGEVEENKIIISHWSPGQKKVIRETITILANGQYMLAAEPAAYLTLDSVIKRALEPGRVANRVPTRLPHPPPRPSQEKVETSKAGAPSASPMPVEKPIGAKQESKLEEQRPRTRLPHLPPRPSQEKVEMPKAGAPSASPMPVEKPIGPQAPSPVSPVLPKQNLALQDKPVPPIKKVDKGLLMWQKVRQKAGTDNPSMPVKPPILPKPEGSDNKPRDGKAHI